MCFPCLCVTHPLLLNLNLNFFITKPTRCTNFTNVFWHPLSIIRSLFTVHSAMVYVIQVCNSFRAGPGWKKIVTMHSHTNVKFVNLNLCVILTVISSTISSHHPSATSTSVPLRLRHMKLHLNVRPFILPTQCTNSTCPTVSNIRVNTQPGPCSCKA